MLLFWVLTGCTGAEQQSSLVQIDGSSTVFPITEAIAEEFQRGRAARVTIGVSGTGGGFKKFCRGEVDITGASRPITEGEVKLCADGGPKGPIEYVELPIAYDGIAVVLHPDNNWANTLTVPQLKKMWEPEAQGKVTRWNQIDPAWPDEELHLFGPGVDSGTYDYFTKAIVGKQHASRGDVTSSEDDNVLVQGVARDKFSLGFFGLAYYEENTDKVISAKIDDGDATNGDGPISPSAETVANGTYQPLSRPVFIYINKASIARQEVSAFIDYYISPEGRKLVREVGYVPLPDDTYGLVNARFKAQTTGTIFGGGGARVGVSVKQMLEGAK